MKLLIVLFSLANLATASLLNQDPTVVYTEEFAPEGIKLEVVKSLNVFASKAGKEKRGRLKLNTKVELVGFNERAFQVRGTRTNGEGVSGWVSPQALTSKNPNFIEDFKKIYKRQLIVRDLIENHEVAIGMTIDEVERSLGLPTKTKTRRTAEGTSDTWEFIVYETVKHYANIRDPHTGAVYRKLVNTTKEEKSKTQVEFENGVAKAIEESEDHSRRGRVRSVAWPIIYSW